MYSTQDNHWEMISALSPHASYVNRLVPVISNVLDNVTKWLYVARSAKISTSKSYAVIAVMVNPGGANARLRDGNWKRNPFLPYVHSNFHMISKYGNQPF
jgi:hypothetical protein